MTWSQAKEKIGEMDLEIRKGGDRREGLGVKQRRR